MWAVAGLTLLACKDPAQENTTTIPLVQAESTTILQESKCFGAENSQCYTLDVQSLTTNVAWINDYFQQALRGFLEPELLVFAENREQQADKKAEWAKLSLEQLKKAYVDSVAALFSTNNEDIPIGYSLEYKPRFIAQNQQLAMFTAYLYAYTGGAHGMYSTHFVNFDLKNKKVLKLDDILLANQQEKFNQLLKQAYLDYLSLTEYEESNNKAEQILADRAEMGWIVEPTDNFTFRYDGLVLSYPPYDLGPYAAGEIELFIPYRKLLGVLKSEYLFNTTETIITD